MNKVPECFLNTVIVGVVLGGMGFWLIRDCSIGIIFSIGVAAEHIVRAIYANKNL